MFLILHAHPKPWRSRMLELSFTENFKQKTTTIYAPGNATMLAHISFKTCSNPTNDPPFQFTDQVLPGSLPHWCSSGESFVQCAQDETPKDENVVSN
jgi:hypothetical protein